MAELIVISFESETQAEAAYNEVKALQENLVVELTGLALVKVDDGGKTHVEYPGAAGRVGRGAAAGHIFEHLFGARSTGIDKTGLDAEFRDQVKSTVRAGKPAVVIYATRIIEEKFASAIAPYRGTIVQTSLSEEDEKTLIHELADPTLADRAVAEKGVRMYYSNGNYEAFARPRKPEGVDEKSAWLVGAGLATMSAAVFMIRDGQMSGERITILERLELPGGALDGIKKPAKGFVIRGGRQLEDHMECLWDLFRSIPSLEIDGASVLDEFYWLDKDDPNYSLCRVTEKQGQDAHTDKLYNLDDKAQKEMLAIFFASHESMEGKRINEVFSDHFLSSNFWLYWRTMFAFEEWHSALEMKLYLHRFVHQIGGLPDLSAVKFTKYNQYESFVLPLYRWLLDQGVTFRFSVEVTDIDFDLQADRKQATRIHWIDEDGDGGVDLGPDDLVLTTIGSLTENSDDGDHHTAAELKSGPAPAWDLWRRIAAKDPSFGHPDVFAGDISKSKWESATVTTLDTRIPAYIEKITGRDPFSGKIVTGGIVTARDSRWLLSWTVNRQPHFKAQSPDEIVAWMYGLFADVPGDYVKKTMQECTGEEITQEWLFHLGVPVEEIPELAASGAQTVPVMMPYVDAFFMPRRAGDRPQVVPKDAVNFAFIGQFTESTRDTIFTTEYSVRTGMEAVYQLLGIERGVPEVFNSTYDLRSLLRATTRLRDGAAVDIPGPNFLAGRLVDKLDTTQIGQLLTDFGVLVETETTRVRSRADDAIV